jgi:hypothetical protein
MSGTPEYRVPNELLEAAARGRSDALAALEAYKSHRHRHQGRRADGAHHPLGHLHERDGTRSNVPMYEFRYNVPQGSKNQANFDPSISATSSTS